MSKFKQAIDQIGLANAARQIGVSPQRLSNWVERGVPVEKCYAVERALAGAVTRIDLRDDWREIWPELAGNESGAPPGGVAQPFADMPAAVRAQSVAPGDC